MTASHAFSQSSGYGSELGIILDDNVSSKKRAPAKPQIPQYDEEFKQGTLSEEQKLEQEIQDSENAQTAEPSEESITREEVPAEKSKSTLEQELKNAEQSGQKLPEEQVEELNFGNAADPEVSTPPAPVVEESQSVEQPSTESDLKQSEVQQPEPIEESYEEETQQAGQLTPEGESEQPVAEAEEEIYRAPKPEQALSPYTPDQPERSYTREELERLSKETKVDVEEEDYIRGTSLQQRSSYLKSFRERRPDWTFQFEAFYSQYEPHNFISADASETPFDEAYEAADMPLSGIGFDIKRNFSFGSVALGASLGYYSAKTTFTGEDTTFSFYAPSARLTVFLDNLFEEPYVVPYITGGYTYFMYEESFDDGISEPYSSEGQTDNFYVGFGALFQLDWLDKNADESAFNAGLQNTFVFVEGRMYVDQGVMRVQEDPDFSTGLYLVGGLRLEF